MICQKFEDEDEFEWMLRGVSNLDTRSRKKKKDTTETLKPLNDFFQGPGEPAHKTQKVIFDYNLRIGLLLIYGYQYRQGGYYKLQLFFFPQSSKRGIIFRYFRARFLNHLHLQPICFSRRT